MVIRIDLERLLSDAEIQNEVNLSPKQYHDLINVSGPTLSLDAQAFYQDSSEDLTYTIPDDPSSSLNTNNTVEKSLLKKQIKNTLSLLTEREKTVLILRYGLDDGKARTQKDVGQFLKISAERVRQIESNAIRILRERLNP